MKIFGHSINMYDLEANSIAVNTDRSQYMLLSSNELRSCSNPLMGFCFAKSPVYKTSVSKLCIIALFLQEEQKVKNCQVENHVTAGKIYK